MAKDSKGNYHRAGFQARKADKMPPPAAADKPDAAEQPEPEDGGDHMHMAAEAIHQAEPQAKHMIVSHDGYGMKTHSIDEAGKHDGPHEDEAAHEHMQRFMGEGGGEPPMKPVAHDEEPMHAGGLY
jgi:hypothetical protein